MACTCNCWSTLSIANFQTNYIYLSGVVPPGWGGAGSCRAKRIPSKEVIRCCWRCDRRSRSRRWSRCKRIVGKGIVTERIGTTTAAAAITERIEVAEVVGRSRGRRRRGSASLGCLVSRRSAVIATVVPAGHSTFVPTVTAASRATRTSATASVSHGLAIIEVIIVTDGVDVTILTIAMSGVVVFFYWLKSKGDVAEEAIFIIGV